MALAPQKSSILHTLIQYKNVINVRKISLIFCKIFLSSFLLFAFVEILASLCKLNVKESGTKSWKFVVTHF